PTPQHPSLDPPHPAQPHLSTLSLHDALPIFFKAVNDCRTWALFFSASAAKPTNPAPTPVRIAAPTNGADNSSAAMPAENIVTTRSEEHTSELQSLAYLVCRLLLEKKKTQYFH